MQIIKTVSEMQSTAGEFRRAGKSIGIVPTMGFLHRGHASLIEQARKLTDIVVTTVFVNPKQFGPNEDFDRYPRDFGKDEVTAREAGTDIVFYPETSEMYAKNHLTYVESERVSTILEGKFRPTHFRGVTTVVAKLFNIVKPNKAFFGQKDAQQAFVVRQMVRDLNFDTDVVIAPIVREPDGLAMSSRNVYLGPSDRRNAAVLFKALTLAEARVQEGIRTSARIREEMENMVRSGIPTGIDYVAIVNPETFEETETISPPSVLAALAVRFGKTRLIDNMLIGVN